MGNCALASDTRSAELSCFGYLVCNKDTHVHQEEEEEVEEVQHGCVCVFFACAALLVNVCEGVLAGTGSSPGARLR